MSVAPYTLVFEYVADTEALGPAARSATAKANRDAARAL
jgi:hypothetical protein